jgi:hypothetical protein
MDSLLGLSSRFEFEQQKLHIGVANGFIATTDSIAFTSSSRFWLTDLAFFGLHAPIAATHLARVDFPIPYFFATLLKLLSNLV